MTARRLAWLCALLSACAHTSPAGTRPAQGLQGAVVGGVPLASEEAVQLRQRMARARTSAQQITATAKMTRFGPEGRLRVTLQLVLQRPNLFRITVLGPHGPPVYAAACDGAQLTALDVAHKTLRRQPATAAGIAYHLGGLDLGLTAEDWVQLFLGEMAIPPEARATRPADGGGRTAVTWAWARAGRRIAAVVDERTGVLQSATIALGDGRVGTLALKGRGPGGMAEHIALHLSAGGKEAAQDVELMLADVAQLADPIGEAAFELNAPAVPSL